MVSKSVGNDMLSSHVVFKMQFYPCTVLAYQSIQKNVTADKGKFYEFFCNCTGTFYSLQ